MYDDVMVITTLVSVKCNLLNPCHMDNFHSMIWHEIGRNILRNYLNKELRAYKYATQRAGCKKKTRGKSTFAGWDNKTFLLNSSNGNTDFILKRLQQEVQVGRVIMNKKPLPSSITHIILKDIFRLTWFII